MDSTLARNSAAKATPTPVPPASVTGIHGPPVCGEVCGDGELGVLEVAVVPEWAGLGDVELAGAGLGVGDGELTGVGLGVGDGELSGGVIANGSTAIGAGAPTAG
jgi:hypothetical protein